MNLAEYSSYDGLGLADLVRRKEVTSAELCELALRGVEAVNPHLNAVIETFPDRARKVISTSGPFAGVPLLVKDFPIEAGVRAEMGSELAAGFRALNDTEMMRRLRNAGFINLGRTTTSEFGLAALTTSRHTGATRNPWDLEISTAGSSGGSAAAVAAGVVPIATGGDGGGSIRNPASFCGLVGLKPTRGRISLGPDSGNPYSGMVVNFVLTRTVRDCAASLDALEGPAVGDPFEIPRPRTPYIDEIAGRPQRLRIALTATAWSGLAVDPEVANAVRATGKLLEDMDHAVEEATPELDYEPFLAAQIDLWSGHTAAAIASVGRAMERKPSPDNLQSTTWAVYEAGKSASAATLVEAEEHYNVVTRRVGAFFEQYDVLVTPTNTCLPLALSAHALDTPGATVKDLFHHLAPIETFTALFNGTGHPAISLPLHESRSGLPIGMQLVARFGAEAMLLRLAASLETARGWVARSPPIHVGRKPVAVA
ncbi:MAG: amidase [Hyphomicrobiales bacterium]